MNGGPSHLYMSPSDDHLKIACTDVHDALTGTFRELRCVVSGDVQIKTISEKMGHFTRIHAKAVQFPARSIPEDCTFRDVGRLMQG